MNEEQYDEEFRRKHPELFRNYRKEPVTAETIKTEAEKPFKDTAQVLATASKLGIAYQTAVRGDAIRRRYQQFTFRGGDDPLVDVSTIPTKPKNSAHLVKKLDGYFGPTELIPDFTTGSLKKGGLLDPRGQKQIYYTGSQPDDYSSMHYATPSLRPEGPYNFRKNQARPLSAEATTGVKVTKEIEQKFLKEGAEQTADLTEQYGFDLGPMNIHHKAFVRQLFESMNGLTKEYRDRSVRYYERALGFKIGYDIENALAIPDAFHPRLHALINSRLSSNPWSWNLKGIEKKFNLTPDWKHYTEYGQRLKVYKEISNVIGDSVRQTKRLYKALSSRTNKLGKLSAEEYTNIGLDLLLLDKKLKGLPSPHFMVKKSHAGIETGSDVINTILKNAGKVDLTLPSFQKLNLKDLKVVAKAELINKDILREALLSKQNPKTIYETWGELIGVSRKEFRDILHRIDPNDLIKSGMSIDEVDNLLSTSVADPTKAKSSLKPLDTPMRTDWTDAQLKKAYPRMNVFDRQEFLEKQGYSKENDLEEIFPDEQ